MPLLAVCAAVIPGLMFFHAEFLLNVLLTFENVSRVLAFVALIPNDMLQLAMLVFLIDVENQLLCERILLQT